MKCAVALFVTLCIAAVHARPQQKYTTMYDDINLDGILDSKKLINHYIQCLLGNGYCLPEGAELRKVLPDALKHKCDKCSESQKHGALKVIQRLRKDYPDEWKVVLENWDPNNEYFTTFQEFLEKTQN